jgi:AbrB family looped-hinge helix DNA binding protein
MSEAATRRRTVKALAKGQITIPNEFRTALGIDGETLLDVALVGDHLEIKPLRRGGESLRRYSDDDIARFLEEDRLDEETARRVRELLKRGEL